MKRFITLAFMLVFISILWLPSQVNAKQNVLPEMDVQHQFEDNYEKGQADNWLYFESKVAPKEILYKINQGKIIHFPINVEKSKDFSTIEGTYALYLKVPRENIGKMLEIHLPISREGINLFLDNKSLVFLEKKKSAHHSHKNELSSNVIFFRPDKTKILLTMQISDSTIWKGTTFEPLYIGVADHEVNSWNTEFFWNCLLIGCNLMVGLFFISIGIYRSYGRDILVFGYFCVAIAIRAFFGVPYIYGIIMPDFSWVVALRFEYFFTCLATFFFIWLIYTISEGIFSKKMFQVTTLLLVILSTIILFTRAEIYQPTFFVMYMWAIPTLIYVVYVLIKSIYLKNKLAFSHMIGIIFVFTAVLLDYFSGIRMIELPPLALAGNTLYVLAQMVFLSKKFSYEVSSRIKLNLDLIALNEDLDKKIDMRTKELQQANKLLQKLAIRDGLTDIYNRHYFNEFMTREFKFAQENDTPLALCIIDVDDFKKYNDFYGHIAGDELLKILAQKMDELVPPEGMLARYGGEEFAVVMPNTKSSVAIAVAQKLQQSIERECMQHIASDQGFITVSIGVATLECSAPYETVNEFINAADQNLYKGKNNGKNTVVYQ